MDKVCNNYIQFFGISEAGKIAYDNLDEPNLQKYDGEKKNQKQKSKLHKVMKI